MSYQVGESYLHRNMLFIRTIDGIEGDTISWHDKHGPGQCTAKVFARQCIALAPKNERELEEIKAEIVRDQSAPRRSKVELTFSALCDELSRNGITHIVINDPRELGTTYEEVMRSLLTLEHYRLYLRIIP